MGKFSCVSVFLPSDTRNGNRDTEFILKDQEKELGIGNLGALFILLKKKYRSSERCLDRQSGYAKFTMRHTLVCAAAWPDAGHTAGVPEPW